MEVLRHIARTHGVFLRSEARDLGCDDRTVARALRAKAWVRVRHGAYTYSDLWVPASEEERHRIRARAVLRSLGSAVALSHVSAAVEHGMRVWGIDLRRVHVTRLDGGAGRAEGDVVHHEGLCLDDDVTERNGVLLVDPARAALETATRADVESGLVVMDSALHLRCCTVEELAARHRLMHHWPHSQHLQLTVRLCDGGAESVGESRARYLCWAHGLPRPTTQFPVRDGAGVLIGTTDFGWPGHRLLGEFDGKVKYGRLRREGEAPGDAVFREKQREDLLREVTGWPLVRLVWADLYRGDETAARITRLLRSAA